MRRHGSLLTSLLIALSLTYNSGVSQAALDAPVDLTNPRIVPLYVSSKGPKPNFSVEASYSGFLYSSRIVFSAAHSEYYFNNDGSIVNREPPEIYVGLPNSKASDLSGIVRVVKRIISKTYRFDGATLDDFVIYVLEKDLITAEPVALLTPEIEQELISTRAEIKVHGYGEYKDRCRPGEMLPCSKKDLKTELPRSLSAILKTLAEAEGIVGYKRPQLTGQLIIANGKPGFGCGGDSGGSITTTYKGSLMYIGPTPNGMNGYACGATGYYDGFGGINYSTQVYKHLEILKEAETFVLKQIELEKSAAEKAAAEKAALTTANNNNKQTITCIKGKSQKKITAINPKCPKGYKKK